MPDETQNPCDEPLETTRGKQKGGLPLANPPDSVAPPTTTDGEPTTKGGFSSPPVPEAPYGLAGDDGKIPG